MKNSEKLFSAIITTRVEIFARLRPHLRDGKFTFTTIKKSGHSEYYNYTIEKMKENNYSEKESLGEDLAD